jgi:SOS response regulatory protein OraA/RecX
MKEPSDHVEKVRQSKQSVRKQTPTQRALGLLTRREHSRKELTRKLAARGVERSDAAEAVEKLTNAGWQNDERFAESLARARAGSGYGPQRIRAELATHGLNGAQIAAALEACETHWLASARHAIRRRYPVARIADPQQRRKAVEFLLRRGFDRADAWAAVGARGDSDADD